VSKRAAAPNVVGLSASEYSQFLSSPVKNMSAPPTETGDVLHQTQRTHPPDLRPAVDGFMSRQNPQYTSALPLPQSSAQHMPEARWVSRPFDTEYREDHVSAPPMASLHGSALPRNQPSTARMVQPGQIHEALTSARLPLSSTGGPDGQETTVKLASDEQLELSQEVDQPLAEDKSMAPVEGGDDGIGPRQPDG
jgi:hypothetical protein